MKLGQLFFTLAAVLAFSVAASAEDSTPNVLLICVDDLRPELGCYGVDYIRTPHIDRLAKKGRTFLRHYVQAPTCGASRYTLLTGKYGGAGNGALFARASKMANGTWTVPPSMPGWFRQHGYMTVSVGKVSHHPGGKGGKDWDDDSKLEMPMAWDRHLLPAGDWRHPRGWMHGLANGEIRGKASEMDVFQSVDGPDSIYPDGVTIPEALSQLDQLTADSEKPFFLAVGILRPHLPFGCPAKYLSPYLEIELPPTPYPNKPEGKTTWHGSGEFMKYNRWDRNPNRDSEFALKVRQHYAACVSYADAQIGLVLDKLQSTTAANNTIVVVWGDHGWHLGEHGIWGKHSLFEESLRSPLIISFPSMAKPGEPTSAIVESLDLFPTLCDLTGLPKPEFVDGVSLRSVLEKPETSGHSAISYKNNARTIRTDSHRLIIHNSGHTELYDHTTREKETKNLAKSNPELVESLTRQLYDRLK